MLFPSDGPVPVIRDKEQPIGRNELYPHYSDRRFVLPSRNRTVFLAPDAVLIEAKSVHDYDRVESVDSYEHSRLVIAGQSEMREAVLRENEGQDEEYEQTAKFYELLLGRVQGQTVDVRHILAGVNVGGDGMPYQDFGVKFL